MTSRVSLASVREGQAVFIGTTTGQTPPRSWILRVAIPAVRRHWVLVTLLIAGLTLRVLTQLAYRPALLYIDSTKYLLHGRERYDPQGYRVLLRVVTWFGNLGSVAAVQHVLGLATAVALYAVLIRRGAPRCVAALAAAPVLLDAYQLQAEQTIMPEVMFEALVVAGLALLLWERRPGITLVVLAGIALGASATARQVGEFLILPAIVYVVLAARGGRVRIGHAAVFAVAFAVPILGHMTYSASVLREGFELSSAGNAMIYGRAAAAADCATLKVPAHERSLCPAPETAAALGEDRLIHDPGSPLQRYRPPKGVNAKAAVKDFSFSVVEQQPLRVIGSTLRDFAKLFALRRHTDQGDTPISRWQFQDTYPTYPPVITLRTAGELFRGTGGGGEPRTVRPLEVLLRNYQLHGGYTPGPYLLVSLLAGLGGIAAYRRGRGAALACVLVTGVGVVSLLAADVVEFSWRYQLPALIMLPAGGAFGVIAIRIQVRAIGRRPHKAGAAAHRRSAKSGGLESQI